MRPGPAAVPVRKWDLALGSQSRSHRAAASAEAALLVAAEHARSDLSPPESDAEDSH